MSPNSYHPPVMSRSLPHLTLTTSTSSLSHTSPIFPTFSPSHPSPSTHDAYLPCEDPRQGGGSTQIPYLTGYEPKVIEPDDFEPEELSLTGIVGQIRIKHREESWEKTTKSLSPKMWMNFENLVTTCLTSSHRCTPITTQRKVL